MSRHSYEKNIKCPWCNHEHEDSWDYGEAGMVECDSCGKEFEFEQDVEVTYSSWKPPVLVRRTPGTEEHPHGS